MLRLDLNLNYNLLYTKIMSDQNNGRPAFDDEWYQRRLDEMAPILKNGNTVGYAADKTGNGQHRNTLYNKYRLNDWFMDKVDALRAIPGELANNITIKLLYKVSNKLTYDLPITKEDIEILKFVAEKHRSSHPFFVTRQEVAQVDPNKISFILDNLERNETDYTGLAIEASKTLENTQQLNVPTSP